MDWALPYKQNSDEECYEPGENGKILFIVHGLTGGSNVNIKKNLKKIFFPHNFKIFKCFYLI